LILNREDEERQNEIFILHLHPNRPPVAFGNPQPAWHAETSSMIL